MVGHPVKVETALIQILSTIRMRSTERQVVYIVTAGYRHMRIWRFKTKDPAFEVPGLFLKFVCYLGQLTDFRVNKLHEGVNQPRLTLVFKAAPSTSTSTSL